jgi:hypothetical protein
MAQMITASIYGANGNDYKTAGGATQVFPVSQILIKALSPAVTYGGVACNSIIFLLPTAPSPIQQQFYASQTAAALATLAG